MRYHIIQKNIFPSRLGLKYLTKKNNTNLDEILLLFKLKTIMLSCDIKKKKKKK